MSDWHPNHLSFDSAGAMALIKNIIDAHLSELSDYLVRIVRGEIWLNGNGSHLMRLYADAAVKETKREITNTNVTLEVGIKMDELPEDGFVRVSVVLHGNQAGGPLMTKPGQITWTKHVLAKHKSTAQTSYLLPDGMNQGEKMDDILKNIEENIKHESKKYVDNFIEAVNADVRRINWSAFLRGG